MSGVNGADSGWEPTLVHARRALALARRGEEVVAEPALLIALARIHLSRGARAAAAARLRTAARISAGTGQLRRHTEAVDLLAAAGHAVVGFP